MGSKITTGALTALCLLLPRPGAASPEAEMALAGLLAQDAPLAEIFAPSFLEAVPEAQLAGILEDIKAQIGVPLSIVVDADALRIETQSHSLTGRVALDGDGQIALLFFDPPTPRATSLTAAVAKLSALGDDVAWLVRRDGEILAGQGADVPMAVGSAFKLAVMAVLVQDVAQGTRDWADVVGLRASHISLPSGQLQALPPGSPLTLHTAAALMIANSDNTATDLLLDVLGRDRVARRLGLDHVLSTREFFALKANAEARARYKAAPPEERPAIAATAAEAPLPGLADVSGDYDPDVEWSVPLSTLCDLIEEVADIPLMALNPGAVAADLWETLAFKGGSEQGVLNLTAAVRDETDRLVCFALTINHGTPIDMTEAVGAFRALQQQVSGGP